MKIFKARRCNFSYEGTAEISQLRSGWRPAPNVFKVPQGRRTFSIVPSGQNFLRTVFQPLRSWLISGCRSATQFATAALILIFATKATAETTNTLSDAEIQGRKLARQICVMRPTENFTNLGILKIIGGNGGRTNISIGITTIILNSNSWETLCGDRISLFQIVHKDNQPNTYFNDGENNWRLMPMSDSGKNIPFANSDFFLADLGLEFFHWPAQKVLPKPTNLVRGRDYTLLESTNPNPSTNGYSRVLTWIDKETGGILQAEAYDFNGKLLKTFAPKSFKKVNGQWELQEMEIRNVQTGSRTRLEFDLKQ
jgi:Outer membrane lipoprotein-sorting protein